jgi:energy-coupling factor transporter ATP-binding protein EcfA2
VFAISAANLTIGSDTALLPVFEVPAAPRYFVGRDNEARECERAVLVEEDPRAVVVSGPPGSGKSTLVFKVAQVLRESQASRSQLYVDVRGVPAEQIFKKVQRHVVAARSPSMSSDEPDDEIASAYLRILDRDNPLVVIDNVAALVKASELERLAGPNVLLTSVTEPFIDSRNVRIESLDPASAALLASRLMPDRTIQLISRVVSLSQGVPLAILILAELAHLNRDRPETEVAAILDAADLATSLDSTFGALTDSLSSDEREALTALCVFTAFFSVSSAGALLQRADARDVLSSLRARGLLDWVAQQDLYRVPSALRQYIVRGSPQIRNRWGLAHALAYTHLLLTAASSVKDQQEDSGVKLSNIVAAWQPIRAEWEDVEAADQWLSEESAAGNKTAAELQSSFHPLFQLISQTLIEAVVSEPAVLSPDWLQARAESYARSGDYDKAVAAFLVAIPHYLERGDVKTPTRLGISLLSYIGSMKPSLAGNVAGGVGKLLLLSSVLPLTEFAELYKRKQWKALVGSSANESANKLSEAGLSNIDLGVRLLLAGGDRPAAIELTQSAEELLRLHLQVLAEARSKTWRN